MAGGGGMPIPNLTLSSGPAISEAGGSGGQSTTGAFYFKSAAAETWQETARQAVPWAIGGLLVWLFLKRMK